MSDKNRFSDSSAKSYSQALYELASEEKKLNESLDFLLTIRCFLHYLSKRSNNKLSFEYQKIIAEKIGEIKELPTKEIIKHTTENALNFFKKLKN